MRIFVTCQTCTKQKYLKRKEKTKVIKLKKKYLSVWRRNNSYHVIRITTNPGPFTNTCTFLWPCQALNPPRVIRDIYYFPCNVFYISLWTACLDWSLRQEFYHHQTFRFRFSNFKIKPRKVLPESSEKRLILPQLVSVRAMASEREKQHAQPGKEHVMDPTPQFSSPDYKPSNKLRVIIFITYSLRLKHYIFATLYVAWSFFLELIYIYIYAYRNMMLYPIFIFISIRIQLFSFF